MEKGINRKEILIPVIDEEFNFPGFFSFIIQFIASNVYVCGM
jgi:hypothetical protein